MHQKFQIDSLQAVAAHICFILGGQPAFPYDATARMCLPGVDHRSRPGGLSDVRGIQRGILLEWAKSQGHSPRLQFRIVRKPRENSCCNVQAILAPSLTWKFHDRRPGSFCVSEKFTAFAEANQVHTDIQACDSRGAKPTSFGEVKVSKLPLSPLLHIQYTCN